MYRYEGHGLDRSTREHKVHKLGGGTKAHEVYEWCWRVGGTTVSVTGVLWQDAVPSLGVPCSMLPQSMCHGRHVTG